MQTSDSGAGIGIGLQGRLNVNDLNGYVNPPADPRLNSIIKKMGSPLRQGIIQQTNDAFVPPQRYPYACRFLFNPTTISVNYGGPDENILDPSKLTPEESAALASVPGKTTLGFSLFFDRTYEVAYGPSATLPRNLRNIGVYADIGALENVVGARFNFGDDPKTVIQPMGLRPAYIIFGGGSDNVGLSFIGAITSMDVTYTTFSERMVPIRAAVNIGVTQMLGRDIGELRAQGGTLLQRAQDRTRRQNIGAQSLPRVPFR